jgi:putative glycosyltransferase (TIGR04372 family)
LEITIKSLLQNIRIFEQQGDFENSLLAANQLLLRDPNNAEYILYKLQALDGLGKVTTDLKLLQHYANMRSSDITAFILLYKAHMALDNIADAIIALTFASSIDPEDVECQHLLASLLAEIDPQYKTVKLNVLTVSRIGHLTCEIEPWARSREGNDADDCLYLFICNGQAAANESLFTLLKNYAKVIISPFWCQLYVSRPLLLVDDFFAPFPYDLNSMLRGVSAFDINIKGHKNLINIYNKSPSIVKIPPDDITAGWGMLAKYGLSPEDRIVCLHVRDSHYLKKNMPGQDYSHHDYRDADIATYKKSVQTLLDFGYKVIRIGCDTNQVLDLHSQNYHDFCSSPPRDNADFLEVLLMSVSQFFIGTTSGPLGTAAIFDTPTLVVNAAPIEQPYLRHSRFIPKRLFHEGTEVNLMDVCRGKSLSHDNLKPILLSIFHSEITGNNYKYQDNSEDDIYSAVIEFEKRVKNRDFNDELTEAQKSYRDRLPNSFHYKGSHSLICDSFLTQYPEIFK